MALTFTPQAQFNSACPEFNLKGVDDKYYRLQDFQNGHALVIMFICNHCPYVQAIEDRLIQLGEDLRKLNVNVVAICSNDSHSHPDDSFENLKKRSVQKKYSFVYLHDESQDYAKKIGAVCTPDFFVYDKKNQLAYRGRLDDSWKDPQKVTRRELFEAVLKLEAEEAIGDQTASMGCSIKWK